jgi:hypothetical protein
MPSRPILKRGLHPKPITLILLLGLSTGITGFVWRWQSLSAQSQVAPSLESPIDQVIVPGLPNPLRRLSSLHTPSSPPLEIPPLLLPQPLPPQEVWPDAPSQTPRPYFSDSDEAAWVAPILEDLAQRRLIKGFPDGTFRPNDPMTRAEFATQLSHLFVLSPQMAPSTVYGDVDPNHWAIQHIQSAIAMGFLTGYPDGTFRPEAKVTRLQVMLALANGLNLKSSSSPERVLQGYLDADQVPPWARTALITALEANLVVNHPNPKRLEPNRDATRAEVVTMLRQTLVYTGQLSPLTPGRPPLPDQPAY